MRAAKYWLHFLVHDLALCDFFAVDGIGILNDAYFFCGYFADDTDSESWAWEWLTEYQLFRDSKLQTGLAYLVFEEVAEWLDDFFEINVVRKSSYVVVGLDDCGFSAKTALYNIRINGSLCKEVYCTDLLRFFFENTDEFFADDLTSLLLVRLRLPAYRSISAVH